MTTQTGGAGNAGRVEVRADTVTLDLALLGSASLSREGGRGGDVDVQTNSLTATTGGQVSSLAFGVGDAGQVAVTAEEISLSGFRPQEFSEGIFAPSAILSTAQPGAVGHSGNIIVNTGQLTIAQAAAILTSTFGTGNAGTLEVNARDSISIDGAVFTDFEQVRDVQPSAIISETFSGAIGEGGTITVTTPRLSLTHGGTISSTSNGIGNAGNIIVNADESVTLDGVASFADIGQRDRISRIAALAGPLIEGNGGTLTITTPQVSLTNGGQLTVSTEGTGNAGSIKLNVSDTVLIDGAGSGILANTTPGSTGAGGSIIIDPQLVLVQNGGRIAVDSQGTGRGGDIELVSDQLRLINQGLITAETLSTDGGNITLNIGDVLLLLDNSRITSTAGTGLAGGNGGNITIDTTFLIASPQGGNNDITANAFSGSGGNVVITAEGIFGITPLSRAELETRLGTTDPLNLDPANLNSNTITAISRQNPALEGQVQIFSPDTDPSQGLTPLPETVIDATRLVVQGCASANPFAQEVGSLVLTGRGGLPNSPGTRLTGHQLLLDWVTVNPDPHSAEAAEPTISHPLPPQRLQEVQALTWNANGEVILVADGQAGTPAIPVLTCEGENRG
jgi:large exoprotein involved in heme utilization and adhesion